MENCSPGSAPIVKGDKLSLKNCLHDDNEKTQMAIVLYASAVGSLQYAQTCTRPNIAFVVENAW